ncbi:MAG: hypothetical protein HY856_13505 [Burkholderiales bacterium]|nr:hypothetical protein [Burkholderiales bacterium]
MSRYTRTAIAATQACMDVYLRSAQAIQATQPRRYMGDVELAIGAVLSVPDLPSPQVMADAIGHPNPLAYGWRLIPTRRKTNA